MHIFKADARDVYVQEKTSQITINFYDLTLISYSKPHSLSTEYSKISINISFVTMCALVGFITRRLQYTFCWEMI